MGRLLFLGLGLMVTILCLADRASASPTKVSTDGGNSSPQLAILRSGPRIISGQDAEAGRFGYQVSLQASGNVSGLGVVSNYHWCGGAIIDSKTILTAAHCFANDITPADESKPLNLTAVAGTHNAPALPTDKYVQTRKIAKVILHEKYGTYDDPAQKIVWHDICILKVEPPFDLEAMPGLVRAIDLQEKRVKPNTTCVASGWGDTGKGRATVLQSVTLPTISAEECATRTGFCKPFLTGMVCHVDPEGHKGTGSGDSGGPVVCDGKLTGVVSWGPGAKEGISVQTDVEYYLKWIHDNNDGVKCSPTLLIIFSAFSALLILRQ